MEDPTVDQDWREFRYEGIRQIVSSAAKNKGDKLLSAAVFATPELARKYVRQDWPKWDLDVAYPMIHHNFYDKPIEWVKTAT